MALKKGLNQVGENPYLPEFVETPQNRCPRVALAWRITLLLGPTRTDSPNTGKFREKLDFLSLKPSLFQNLLSPLPLPDSSKNGEEMSSFVPSLLHVKPSLDYLDFLSTYPPTFDFPPIRRFHMSTWALHLSSS